MKRFVALGTCSMMLFSPLLVEARFVVIPPSPTLMYSVMKGRGGDQVITMVDDGGTVGGRIVTSKVPRSFLRKARGSDKRLKRYIKSISGASEASAGVAAAYGEMTFRPDGTLASVYGSDGTRVQFKPAKKGRVEAKGRIGGEKIKTRVFKPARAYISKIKKANKLISKGGKRRQSAKGRVSLRTFSRFAGNTVRLAIKGAGIALAGVGFVAGGVTFVTVGGGAAAAVALVSGIGLIAGMVDLAFFGIQTATGRPVYFAPYDAASNGVTYGGILADFGTGAARAGARGIFLVGLDRAAAEFVNTYGVEAEDFRVINSQTLTFTGGPNAHTTNWVTPIGWSGQRRIIAIFWDMYSISDSIRVTVDGANASGFPVGLTSNNGYNQFDTRSNSVVRVVINAGGNPNSSTAWTYSIALVR